MVYAQTQHPSHCPGGRLQEVHVVFGAERLAAGRRVEHLGGRAPSATVASTASDAPVVSDSLVHEREHAPRLVPDCGRFDWLYNMFKTIY